MPKIHKLDERLAPTVSRELADAYRDGASTADLREQFDLSQPSVLKLLGEQGVKMRHKGLTPDDEPMVVARYEAGQTLKQIADHLHVSIHTVRRVLVAHGVCIRPRRHQTK